MALLYVQTGRAGQAGPLFDEATAHAVNNLSALYYRMGEIAKAQPLCLRYLQFLRGRLGEDDLRLASPWKNLAEMDFQLGRISKAVTNSADWNATYHYYYDGYRMIETHDGSADVLKQQVCGPGAPGYVDELIQIGLNDDPSEDDDPQTEGTQDDCETFYYAMQDANYNVLGLADSSGDLKERYEYSPYGQRTVYKSSGSNDDLCSAPILESQPHPDLIGSLCDIGHQGLLHDKEFGLIYNRARYLHPLLGRFLSRDPLGYLDGMNLYEYVRSRPLRYTDSAGLYPIRILAMSDGVHEDMSSLAALWAGFEYDYLTEPKTRFHGGLRYGASWPDRPGGTKEFLEFFGFIHVSKLSPEGAALLSGAWKTYSSHYGDRQWMHGMKPPGWTNCDVRNKIVTEIVKYYKAALAKKNSNDLERAGMFMGAGLHFLQDTYCLTHTTREWTTGIDGKMHPGAIVNFQDYSRQTYKEHKNPRTGCVATNEESTPQAIAADSAAFGDSVSLLHMLKRNAPAEEVQKWLLEGPMKLRDECDCPLGGPKAGSGRGGPPAPPGSSSPPRDVTPYIIPKMPGPDGWQNHPRDYPPGWWKK